MLAAMSLSAQPLPYPDRTPPGPPCTDCPNIIFSLTDDQDLTLGGWDPMRQTQAAIQSAGATLSRWTIHTPICSPSRSETISGRYFHNIKSDVAVPPPVVMPAATGHVNGSLYDNQSVAYLLRTRKGYQAGLFGKSNFNTYQGFDRWFQGAALGYGNTWEDDEGADGHYHANKSEYATALLSNKTVEWLMRPGVGVGLRPFFAYFAPHCPHSPATPAHWYADACPHTTAPRQPNWNYSDPSFHELIASQPPFTPTDARLIDDLARSRCQCLLSVDDGHAAIDAAVTALGVAHKTYWFVSSDHGYNLGGHRLPSNKFLLYDHSLRIPMVIRGPGVPAGVELPHLGTNVDFAPTWLELAGLDVPAYMDGRSVLSFVVPNASAAGVLPATRAALARVRGPPGSAAEAAAMAAAADPAAFRTESFVQYYNQGPWIVDNGGDQCPICAGNGTTRVLDDYSNTYIGLTVDDPAIGRWKYGEYQNVCSSAQVTGGRCFDDVTTTELFDLDADPWELSNVAGTAPAALLAELHARLRAYYPCRGASCP